MMFRIGKCLTNDGVQEFAIFENGDKSRIYDDKDGGKYFCVPNRLNNSKDSVFVNSFKDRIKDAYDTVAAGDGDCFAISKTFVFGEKAEMVIRFLDREIGEEHRKKFLDGFKDTQFGYCIKAGNKNSFYCYMPIDKDFNVLGFGCNQLRYVAFETEAEAYVFVDKILHKARAIAQEIVDKYQKNLVPKESFEKDNVGQIWDEIIAREGESLNNTIIFDFIFDMLNEDGSAFRREDKGLSDFGIKVCQCIIHSFETVKESEWEITARILAAGRNDISDKDIIRKFKELENGSSYGDVLGDISDDEYKCNFIRNHKNMLERLKLY